MRKFVLLISALVWAALLSQFPEFYQQYTQRLGGRLDELNLQMRDLDARAGKLGLTRFEYVRRFINNPDQVIQLEGQNLSNLMGRQIAYTKAFNALQNAPPLWRAVRFAEYFDEDIALPTVEIFKPAVPLTIEGAIYSGTGFLIGWLSMFGLVRRRRRRRPPNRREPDIYA
jgi:hypothetical protein